MIFASLGRVHRIGLVETRTAGSDDSAPKQQVRYQHDDHLGSAVVELDEALTPLSYEEYQPYGTTALSLGLASKRYRFSGVERDEETGLQSHGVRYYAPWLGRWTCADPIGLRGGINAFAYCSSSPVNRHDPGGTKDEPAKQKRQRAQLDWMITNGKREVAAREKAGAIKKKLGPRGPRHDEKQILEDSKKAGANFEFRRLAFAELHPSASRPSSWAPRSSSSSLPSSPWALAAPRSVYWPSVNMTERVTPAGPKRSAGARSALTPVGAEATPTVYFSKIFSVPFNPLRHVHAGPVHPQVLFLVARTRPRSRR